MAQFPSFTVCLYWGGQQVLLPGLGVSYYPHVAKESIEITEKLTYNALVERIYEVMNLDITVYKLNLTFRLPTHMGMHMALRVVKDRDLEKMYELAKRYEDYCAEMFVDIEAVYPMTQPSQSGFLSLLQSMSHGDVVPPFAIGGSSFSRQLDCVHPLVEPRTSVGLHVTNVCVGRVIENGEMEQRRFIGDVNVTMDSEEGNQFVDRAEQIDRSASPPSSAEESLGYEDVGDDSNGDNDGGNVEGVTRDIGQHHAMHTPEVLEFFNNIGEDCYDDPYSRTDNERIHVWSEENRQIRLRLRFVDKKQLKRAITLWSIEQNREFKVWESKGNTWVAKCKTLTEAEGTSTNSRANISCMWCVRARRRSTHGMWEITKLVIEHNCSGGNRTNHHCNFTSTMIATRIRHSIETNPCYAVKSIQTDIKNDLGVDISYNKAWHGRRRAIELIYGSWEDSFARLPKYMEALKMTNPSTVIEWLHHPKSAEYVKIFKYVFWAFAPAVEAFKKCRPVISVDGTHLRSSYKGKLLVAVTHDANNGLLPLAFAIVDEETNESWCWFMRQLRRFVVFERHPLCVLSDRHKGLLHAMTHLEEWKEPMAYHRFCLRHVRSNFNSRFKNLKLKKLVWALGCARQKRKWKSIRTEVRSLDADAWEYLNNIGRNQWCLAYDGDYRWGTLTTNISESYNNVLKGARHLPIQSCVDHIWHRTSELFKDRFIAAQHCQYALPKNIWNKFRRDDDTAKGHKVVQFDVARQVYEVTTKYRVDGSGGHVHTVEYLKRVCTCGKWQMYRQPCSHAIAVCRKKKHDPLAFFDSVYHVDTFVDQYSGHFVPLPHCDYWPDPGWELKMNEERFISHQRGRIRASRIPCEQDERLPEDPSRCSRCHLSGHNRMTCEN